MRESPAVPTIEESRGMVQFYLPRRALVQPPDRSAGGGADRTVLQHFSGPSPARHEGCKKIATLSPRDLSRKRAGEVQSSRVLPQFCNGLRGEKGIRSYCEADEKSPRSWFMKISLVT